MPNKEQRFKDNAPGNWYVDDSCINCALCGELAPKNFASAPSDAYSIVVKQPENDQEIAACEEALSSCPVDCIGRDGA